jgi:hypothetical protein
MSKLLALALGIVVAATACGAAEKVGAAPEVEPTGGWELVNGEPRRR